MATIKLSKIALGAWARGNDAATAAVTLNDSEVAELEELADSLGINTIRFWEKVMD